jgi:excisionase family DNA binding protein
MSAPASLNPSRRRRPSATRSGYRAGRPVRTKGRRYPPDPPRPEEIIAVMRCCSDGLHGLRARGLIAVLWRSGLQGPATANPCRPLFDRESLANHLRLSTDTIDWLVKAGRLPCVRIGSQVRFTSDDVEAFIASHRQLGLVA